MVDGLLVQVTEVDLVHSQVSIREGEDVSLHPPPATAFSMIQKLHSALERYILSSLFDIQTFSHNFLNRGLELGSCPLPFFSLHFSPQTRNVTVFFCRPTILAKLIWSLSVLKEP